MKLALWLCCSLFAFFLPLAAQEIRTEDVTRILRTLSSDAMEGRGSLTPGNERAGDFLIGEFKSIGLAPLPGAEGFAQDIPVTSVTPGLREVTLNGKAFAPDSIIAISDADSLSADQTGGIALTYVGAAENPRKRVNDIMRGKANTLVVLSPAHRQLFQRYKGFFGKPSIKNRGDAESPTLVIVVADFAAFATYSVRVVNALTVRTLRNIVGVIPGKRRDESVVFSGHYDHLGIITPVDGDSIANGADDDASGTTAVVTLARYFKARGTPERTLIFAAFAAEEIGGFGSKYFSKQLKPESIVAMCNIEMIGLPSKFGPNSAWITGFDLTSFGPILAEAAKGSGFTFYPDPYASQNLFYRSDNATLARLGVPAHSISSSPIDADPYYHTVNDEFETLSMEHVASVIRGIANGMEPIVAGEKTPTRVKDGSLK